MWLKLQGVLVPGDLKILRDCISLPVSWPCFSICCSLHRPARYTWVSLAAAHTYYLVAYIPGGR